MRFLNKLDGWVRNRTHRILGFLEDRLAPFTLMVVPSIYSSARRRVSANFDNTSKIRAFGSVRIFGDDAKGLSFGIGRGIEPRKKN